jgi:hypothetical protein
MQTFTFQRSSKALSVHVDGCNISVSSAVLRGVRPKPKHHARMERAAAAPRIKRRHSSPRVDRQPRPVAVLGDCRLSRARKDRNSLSHDGGILSLRVRIDSYISAVRHWLFRMQTRLSFQALLFNPFVEESLAE